MSPARRSKQAAPTETEATSPRRSTRSSTKRKSDDAEGTRALVEPQPAKKQKLPVRAKGLPEVKKLCSEAPSFKRNPSNVTEEVREQEEEEPAEEEIPKPQRKQAPVRDAASDPNGDFNDKPIEGETQGDAAPEKSTYESASEEPTEEKTTASEHPASQKSGTAPTPPKSKKIVFDDNYDFKAAAEAARLASTATVGAKAQDVDSIDEDDDDEAPEDESATKVSSRADKAQLVALEAAARQAAVQKQKRKERDALFKKQAEERKTTQPTAQEPDPAPKNEIAQQVSDMDVDTEPAAAGALKQGRERFDKTNIPSLLPAEFLESDGEEDEDGYMMDLDEPAVKKPRKIKFGDFSEQASRDERIGSTLYRVASKGMDKRLAPKVDKASQIKRRDLMMRKKKAVKKSSGFFRNRK